MGGGRAGQVGVVTSREKVKCTQSPKLLVLAGHRWSTDTMAKVLAARSLHLSRVVSSQGVSQKRCPIKEGRPLQLVDVSPPPRCADSDWLIQLSAKELKGWNT